MRRFPFSTENTTNCHPVLGIRLVYYWGKDRFATFSLTDLADPFVKKTIAAYTRRWGRPRIFQPANDPRHGMALAMGLPWNPEAA